MSKYRVPSIGSGIGLAVDLTVLNSVNQFIQSSGQIPDFVKTVFGIGSAFGTLEIGRKAVDKYIPSSYKSIANAGVDLAAATLLIQQLPNLMNLMGSGAGFLAGQGQAPAQ